MNDPADRIAAAWRIAAQAHHGQTYATPRTGITVPYLTHLGQVALEMTVALRYHPAADADLALCSAILHDLFEDTDYPPENLELSHGPRVRASIRALTKNESLPSKTAQMEDSLDRILQQSPETARVKLCDRICNLGSPPAHWNATRIKDYRMEASHILDRLGHTSNYLADRLARKIEDYGYRNDSRPNFPSTPGTPPAYSVHTDDNPPPAPPLH